MKPFFCSTLIVISMLGSLHAESVSISSIVAKSLATNPEVRFYEAEIAASKGGERTAATVANPELQTSLGAWKAKDLDSSADSPAWAVTLSQTTRCPRAHGWLPAFQRWGYTP